MIQKTMIISILLAATALADSGGDSSGGGDFRSLQFVQLAWKLDEILKPMAEKGIIDLGAFDFSRFEKAIQKTKVSITTEKIFVNGIEKDAKNDPNKKPPEIVLNADRWDAIAEGSRRGALALHEYLGIMGIDDRKYQISSKLYDDPTLRATLNNFDFASAPDSGQELYFALNCQLYDHGILIPNALGHVAPPVAAEWISDSVFFTKRVIRDTDQGMLVAVVDTGTDPVTQLEGSFKTEVKRPAIRISIGYGDHFMAPPTKILLQTDLRVTADFDAVVTEPSEQITVHCARLTQRDLSSCNKNPSGMATEPIHQKTKSDLFNIYRRLKSIR